MYCYYIDERFCSEQYYLLLIYYLNSENLMLQKNTLNNYIKSLRVQILLFSNHSNGDGKKRFFLIKFVLLFIVNLLMLLFPDFSAGSLRK